MPPPGATSVRPVPSFEYAARQPRSVVAPTETTYGARAGYAIAVDSLGHAHVTGYTLSADFPVTPGAFDTTCGLNQDCNKNGLNSKGGNASASGIAFVTKLNVTGSALLYSTFLGGSDTAIGLGIAVDKQGHAYVAATVEKLAGVLAEIARFEMPARASEGARAP